MKAEERRKAIADILLSSASPVSGGELSKRLSASRQIIVQDISVLRASGYDIISTHQGYIISSSPLCERVFKVRHSSLETAEELSLIVQNGGTVVDVFVWHKVYGKIQAKLNIFSIHSIEKFMDGIKTGRSTELMHITDGYHYHTVRAESEDVLDRIQKALENKNFIVEEKD